MHPVPNRWRGQDATTYVVKLRWIAKDHKGQFQPRNHRMFESHEALSIALTQKMILLPASLWYLYMWFLHNPPREGRCLCGKNKGFQKQTLAPGSSGQQQAERSGIGAFGRGKQHVLRSMLRKSIDKWWLIGYEKGDLTFITTEDGWTMSSPCFCWMIFGWIPTREAPVVVWERIAQIQVP